MSGTTAGASAALRIALLWRGAAGPTRSAGRRRHWTRPRGSSAGSELRTQHRDVRSSACGRLGQLGFFPKLRTRIFVVRSLPFARGKKTAMGHIGREGATLCRAWEGPVGAWRAWPNLGPATRTQPTDARDAVGQLADIVSKKVLRKTRQDAVLGISGRGKCETSSRGHLQGHLFLVAALGASTRDLKRLPVHTRTRSTAVNY